MYKVSSEEAMGKMVRKRIYIQERQERLLKRISKARGVSEAELIRQAIERETIGGKPFLPVLDQAAWEKILSFIENRKSPRPSGRVYKWNRLDAYQEREKYFTKPKSERLPV
jgi:hypothetical protein